MPSHWLVFESTLDSIHEDTPLNQFMSVDAVEAFARHLGFEQIEVHRGDEPFIPLVDGSSGSDSGTELGSIGQSVAILRKPLDGAR